MYNHFHTRDRLLLLGHVYTLMGEAADLWRTEQKELKGSRETQQRGRTVINAGSLMCLALCSEGRRETQGLIPYSKAFGFNWSVFHYSEGTNNNICLQKSCYVLGAGDSNNLCLGFCRQYIYNTAGERQREWVVPSCIKTPAECHRNGKFMMSLLLPFTPTAGITNQSWHSPYLN